MPAADLLRLGGAHAIRVVGSADGPRAAPYVREGDGWRRATPGDGAGAALLDRLYDGSRIPDGFRISAPAAAPAEQDSRVELAMGVDQTHDSWIVGGGVVVKWLTEPLTGAHPAAGRLRRLAAARFRESPELWGVVEWREPEQAEWVPVAIAQTYLPDTEDGWTWAVLEARRALRIEPGRAQDFAAELGEVIGRMHLALAAEHPARLTPELARAHADEALLTLDVAVDLLEDHDPASHALLLAHRSQIEGILAGLADAAGALVLPVHGDLHVGQVLRGPQGYAVVDFDGNPTRTAALRAQEAPAAMDVADMLVSLENVSHVARHGVPTAVDPAEGPALDWTAAAWTGHAQGLFLSGYRRALGDRLDLFDPALVPAYAWEQLLREFVYALRHDLPEWLYVPAAGLRRRLEES